MEEKKFDFNSLIGFVLLGAIMLWWMYTNQPTPEELEAEKNKKTEQVEENSTSSTVENAFNNSEALQATDSLSIEKAKSALGEFAYSATVANEETVLENDVLKLIISNKGGQIKEALIKNYVTYDSLPLYMVKDQNASFNINFGTSGNRILNTKELMFEPTISNNGSKKVLSMKLKVSENKYLEYRYEMTPDEYMVDFYVKSQGLNSTINSAQQITLDWSLEGFRHEKSIR